VRRDAVVVLAAGRGVRMRSELPKVLHEVAGRPMLDRVVAQARRLAADVVVVAGAGRERVIEHLSRTAPDVKVVVQDPPLGTGDAVRAALPAIAGADRVVVLSGDVPLLGSDTLDALLCALTPGVAVAFLTTLLPDAGAYGRVVRDPSGAVTGIVEAKDATPEQRAIREINAGVYVFDRVFLVEALPRLSTDNAAGEYYLTDTLSMAVAGGRRLAGVVAADPEEVLGANSRADLARLEARLRERAADAAMAGGATLLRPGTVTLDDTVVLSPDTVVEPYATLLGATRVGSGSRIGQGSVIRDCVLGRDVQVKPYCVMERAEVGDGAVVGPFARLREGTVLGPDVHVGNFVETKKARLARGVKANHLTYLGDTVVGERTNVGAGVITCNYDGFAKHTTTIGADVFVGSDVQLVAPVTIGDGAIVGAGTTVTKDVAADALTTSRSPQRTIEAGGAAYRARKKGTKTR